MRPLVHSLIPVLLVATGAGLAGPGASQETPEATIQGLMSDDAATRVAAEAAAVELGAPMVKPLCDLMATGDTKSVTVAERALFAIAAAASAPGNQAEADAVAQALTYWLERHRWASVPGDVICLLGLLPGASATGGIYGALVCGDPGAREAARAALERQGDELAVWWLDTTLCNPHHGTLMPSGRRDDPDPTFVAAIRTLGARRDPSTVPCLTTLVEASSWPPRVKTSALDALGMVADPASAPVLAEAAGYPDEAVRSAAVGALIALADAEQQRGGNLARRCYRRAHDYAVTPAQKTAALMGLADTDPSMRVQWLLRGMGETHARRLAHAELLKLDAAQLAGPLAQRMAEAQGEELEALRALAAERGLPVADH